MSKRNIKIFITSLTICLSTLSFYNASAMKFKQIEINTPEEENKKETIEISKKNIKNYKKAVMECINNINENCCEEYGSQRVKKSFQENLDILKNQLDCLNGNKIKIGKFISQLEKFKILKIDKNKRYKFPDEETENAVARLINYIKNFLDEKKDELDEYINKTHNKKQSEITKKTIDLYKDKITNYKNQLNNKNLDKETKNKIFQTLFNLLNITSNNKFNFENFVLILSNLENNNSHLLNNSDYKLYYLQPETKKDLEDFINKEKNYLKNQNVFCITEEIISDYIKEMNSSLFSFIGEYMNVIQNKILDRTKLNHLENKVKTFFCFDDEEFNYNKFLNSLKNLNYLNHIFPNSTYKKNENYIITKSDAKNLKSHIEITKKIIKNINLEIKYMSKTFKDDDIKKKYKNADLIKNSINSYLNKFLKNKIDLYKHTIEIFLRFYETNGFINENLKNFLEKQKNNLLNYICLNYEKKLDKKNFIENLKHFIKKFYNGDDCNKIDFIIPEYYEKKLEENFNENKKIMDDLYKEFQIKYENITKEINNKKSINNKDLKKITKKMVDELGAKFNEEIYKFDNLLKENIKNEKNIKNFNYYKELEDYIEINKIDLLNNLCLTEEKKLFNKEKFIKLLKNFNIIDDLNYEINENNEWNITSLLFNVEKTLNIMFSGIDDFQNNINEIKTDPDYDLKNLKIPITKRTFSDNLDEISKVVDNFANVTSKFLKGQKTYQELCEAYDIIRENSFIDTDEELNLKNFLKKFNIGYDEEKKCFTNNDPTYIEIKCSTNYIKEIKARIDEDNEKLKNCFKQLQKNGNDLFLIDLNEKIISLLSLLKSNYKYFSSKIKEYINKYRKNCVSSNDVNDLTYRYYTLSTLIFLTPDEKLDEKNLLEILNFYDYNIFGKTPSSISEEQKKELENIFKKYKLGTIRLLNILYYTCRKDHSKMTDIKIKIEEIEETKKLGNFLKEYNSSDDIKNKDKEVFNKFKILNKYVINYKTPIVNLRRKIDKIKMAGENLVGDDNKNIFDYIYDLEQLICLDKNEKFDFEKFKNNLECLDILAINPNIEYIMDNTQKYDIEIYSRDLKKFIEKNKKLNIKNKNIITNKMVSNFLEALTILGNKVLEINIQYNNSNKYNKKDLLKNKEIIQEFESFLYLGKNNANEIDYVKLTDKLREMGYLEIDENNLCCQFEDQENKEILINKLTSFLKIFKEKKILDYYKKLKNLENINNNAPAPNFNINIIPSTKVDSMFNLSNLELYKNFSKKIENFYNTNNNTKNNKKNNNKKNNNTTRREKLKDIVDDYMKMYKLTFLKDKEKLNKNAIKEIDRTIKEDLKINDLNIINSDFAKYYKNILENKTKNLKEKFDKKINEVYEKNKNDANYIKDQIDKNIENLEKEFKNDDINNENYINDENEGENKIIIDEAAPIINNNKSNKKSSKTDIKKLKKEDENETEEENKIIIDEAAPIINNSNNEIKINKPNNIDELKNNVNELQNRFKNIVDNFSAFLNDYSNFKDLLIASDLTDILDKDNVSKFNNIYNNFLSENKTITKKQNEKRIEKEKEQKKEKKQNKNKK